MIEIMNHKNLVSLNLSRNDGLQWLNVAYCYNLSRIAISNQSCLVNYEAIFCAFDEKSRMFLGKTVERNRKVNS